MTPGASAAERCAGCGRSHRVGVDRLAPSERQDAWEKWGREPLWLTSHLLELLSLPHDMIATAPLE